MIPVGLGSGIRYERRKGGLGLRIGSLGKFEQFLLAHFAGLETDHLLYRKAILGQELP